jgi:hypothetical protein
MPRIREWPTERTAADLAEDAYFGIDEQSGTQKSAKVEISELIEYLEAELELAHTQISGLGTAATRNVGTTAGTVAAGDDSRFGEGTTTTFPTEALTTARDIVDADAGKELTFGSGSADDWTGRLKSAVTARRVFTFRNADSTTKTLSAEGTLKDHSGVTLTDYQLPAWASVFVVKDNGTTWRVLAPTPERILTNDQTGTSYSLALGDAGKVVRCSNANAVTVVVPADTFAEGDVVGIEQGGAGIVTLDPETGVTVVAEDDDLATSGQHAVRVLRFRGANVATYT